MLFEELLSLRLSDPFALVVGCINNNWLSLDDYTKAKLLMHRITHYLNWHMDSRFSQSLLDEEFWTTLIKLNQPGVYFTKAQLEKISEYTNPAIALSPSSSFLRLLFFSISQNWTLSKTVDVFLSCVTDKLRAAQAMSILGLLTLVPVASLVILSVKFEKRSYVVVAAIIMVVASKFTTIAREPFFFFL